MKDLVEAAREYIKSREDELDYGSAVTHCRMELLDTFIAGALYADKDRVRWTKARPTIPGYYWFKRRPRDEPRVIKVWKYNNPKDQRMFTNEDGGASTGDEIYHGGLWSDKPFPAPKE